VNSINVLQFISPQNFITSIYLKSNIKNHFILNIQSCPFPCLKSCVGIKILVKTFRTTSLIITCQKKFITIIPTQLCNIPIFFSFYLVNKFECYAKIISHSGKIPLKYFSLYKIPTTMPNMAFKRIYPTV
jgi:hypothetical protein